MESVEVRHRERCSRVMLNEMNMNQVYIYRVGFAKHQNMILRASLLKIKTKGGMKSFHAIWHATINKGDTRHKSRVRCQNIYE